jgi:hypothetical protein
MISNLFLIVTSILTFTGKQISNSHANRVETEKHRVELMEEHCPPVHILGSTPSLDLLNLYQEQCEPLKLYLQSSVKKRNP